MGQVKRGALIVALSAITLTAGLTVSAGAHVRRTEDASSCRLAGGIQHVIYVVWDNTHLLRDNPNVPSDLEQMPHLLNFLRGNGALLTNEHTPLIAHTANDVVTSETGLYPDRQGLNVANSYGYFRADGSVGFQSAFTYWTDLAEGSTQSNPVYNLVTPQGLNAPAPWVPYTRAGCNFGAIASGDIALENTSTGPTGDITEVFGAGSPLWNEAAKENAKSAPSGLAPANFEGLAVHCAKGSSVCSNGEQDNLPDEPGGYTGFKGLFGALEVNPLLTGQPDTTQGGYMRSPALTNLGGQPITDGDGNAGFPGFDGMAPGNSLAFVASMQEHGVPVTYAYLTDAHDNQAAGVAFGPGEAGYVAQLKAYDQAFAAFFDRLARDGINKHNTVFVFTADEGDHYTGAKPLNPGCDGVTTPCQYDPSKIGEIDGDLAPIFQAETGNTTKFAVHSDSAPVFYVPGTPGMSPPPTDPAVRQLERDAAYLWAFNPITNRNVKLANYLADPAELRLLHMETGDVHRNPTFVMFANPNYYLDATNSFGCPPGAAQPGCIYQYQGDAYNHGDVAPEINRTWLGLVGPGVRELGQTAAVWSDHTDDRPTIMALTGLRDDYTSQGEVLTAALDRDVVNPSLRTKAARQMESVYKQLEAPVGQLGLLTLRADTGALAAGDPGDAIYSQCTDALKSLGEQRDAVGARMQALLDGAEFHHQWLSEGEARAATAAGEAVLAQALATQEFCT